MAGVIRQFVSSFVHPQTRARLIQAEMKIQRTLLKSGVGRVLEPFMLRRYLERPEELDIEVTSLCDADCIMCPRRSMRRQQGPMDLNLFRKIVDEALELGVKELHLNGYGEISTLKNYREYISYIRDKSRTVKIIINSNGMRMHEDLAAFYVEMAVNVVNVTIDGATAETFESIRKHLKLDQVEGNVKRLIQIRNEAKKRFPMVLVQMIHMPQNQHETELFMAKWKGVADYAGISGVVSRLGSVKFVQLEDGKSWQQTPCFYLWRQMPVWSDGTVALCCDDWDGKGKQGNLNTSTIKEIWTSAKRQKLREIHVAKQASNIKLCDDCRQPRKGPWWFQN